MEIVVEATQPGARVAGVAQRHPTFRRGDIFHREVGGVHLVHVDQHVGEGRQVGGVVVVEDQARGRRGDAVLADEVALDVHPVALIAVMVEPHPAAGHEGQIDDDVVSGDLDLDLLHIARVRKADVGDIVHDAQENRTGKPVQIAASNHSHGVVSQP
ncbi:MAG: hypothetical protein QF719_03925 [Chloroflexota bacterium]|jgi:hypothetical protein|nr:hypothetical protein [Chloroflexota bacterium]MDP6507631.1 hypothetical protein [Chloroflexota bacterium]MDP6757345.1 hypothetical protein [Chloroflexota bacterium]